MARSKKLDPQLTRAGKAEHCDEHYGLVNRSLSGE
jgi:hypothetical protein